MAFNIDTATVEFVVHPLPILICCLLFFSYKYNLRRTEDKTHALWARVFEGLISGMQAGPFYQSAPQVRLYESTGDTLYYKDPVPDSDSVSANVPQTTSGTVGKEVILDFCLLLPMAEAVAPVETSLQSAIQNFFADNVAKYIVKFGTRSYKTASNDQKNDMLSCTQSIELNNMRLPLIAELKRSVSRHSPDILRHCTDISTNISLAQTQVLHQAHCMFSLPAYASQDNIMLIAGCGEWWTFCYVTRQNMQFSKAFDVSLYERGSEIKKSRAQTVSYLHKLYNPQTIVAELEKDGKPDDGQEMTSEQNKSRRGRFKKREGEIKTYGEGTDASFKALHLCLEELQPKMSYKQSELAKVYELWLKACSGFDQSHMPPTLSNSLLNFSFEYGTINNIHECTMWSPLLRLGTNASNNYLHLIREELRTILEHETPHPIKKNARDYPGLNWLFRLFE
ncbi:hypothetical protein CVT24_004698 [Panaeolus cyanescens]|uniref:Uncharacterized protein n=1 Tax=Panaeolus cyanescens TaxID=181874 RepID=A0A409YST6_9AGAR|nr:hypothetical protein CVT24_004698 [Panaeolus cyanescens]